MWVVSPVPADVVVAPGRRHSYAVVDGPEHALELSSAFVTDGVANAEQVTLVGLTDRRVGSLLNRLREDGADPDGALRDGQLVIVDRAVAAAFYAMTAPQLTDELTHRAMAAVRYGYSGIRFGGLLLGFTVSPHEPVLNRLVQEQPVTALCLYHPQATAGVITEVDSLHERRVRSTAMLDDGQLRVSTVARHGLRLAGEVHPGNRARLLSVLTVAAMEGRRTVDAASLRQIDAESLHDILTSGLGLRLYRQNPAVQRLTRQLAVERQRAPAADVMARTGNAIPGQTASAVVTNLIWRTFGHTRRNRAESVLDWVGLLGRPAGSVVEVADRQHISAGTLSNRIRQVTSRGAQIPLTPVQLRDASRTTAPTEDELSHRRIAQLLGLPSPPPTTN